MKTLSELIKQTLLRTRVVLVSYSCPGEFSFLQGIYGIDYGVKFHLNQPVTQKTHIK